MIDPKNTVVLTGGVVTDPEVINDNILKLRVGVDFAGQEKGSPGASGYFDVVYYYNNEDNARNAKFVRSQVSDGKLKKGSQVQLVGRLVQERWTGDNDKKGARVVIAAESISYAGSNFTKSSDETSSSQADVPSSF